MFQKVPHLNPSKSHTKGETAKHVSRKYSRIDTEFGTRNLSNGAKLTYQQTHKRFQTLNQTEPSTSGVNGAKPIKIFQRFHNPKKSGKTAKHDPRKS